MTASGPLRKALIDRLLAGEGTTSHSERRAAFENTGLAEPIQSLVQKVTTRSTSVTDRNLGTLAGIRTYREPNFRCRERVERDDVSG